MLCWCCGGGGSFCLVAEVAEVAEVTEVAEVAEVVDDVDDVDVDVDDDVNVDEVGMG
jgi:hypothetical protein